MKNSTTMQMACDEREDFADLLDGLSPEQWEQPTLCARWRVRDVVAHVLSYDELGLWQLARRFAHGRLLPNRINAIGVTDYASRSPELLDYALSSPAVRGATRARGVRLLATDLDWVHGSGPEVTGPAEALLMAMAARPDALKQLFARGKTLLAQRICA